MNQYSIILQALDIIVSSRLWKDKKPSEILHILMYVHNKGFLYTPMVDDKISAVICAYRIPEVNDFHLNNLPVEESGTILYVPLAMSLHKEANMYNIVRQSLREYLEINKDITELVLENKEDKLRRYNLKGEGNGKVKSPESASTTDIPRESESFV